MRSRPMHSARHLAAGISATLTRVRAILHATHLEAIGGALITDFGADFTECLGVIRVDQHQMCRRAADFGARHHEPEVLGLDVLSADLQTVRHGRVQARLIAGRTGFDAGSRDWCAVIHGSYLI